MKKYFVLYLAPVAEIEKMMASSTKEQKEAGMNDWNEWMSDNEESIPDMGAMLGKTKRVTSKGVEDVKNDVAGYMVVEAKSHADAAELFEEHPHFQIPGATIDIMEIVPMDDMPKPKTM